MVSYSRAIPNAPLRVPAMDAEEMQKKAFMERYFNYESSYRCRHLERMSRNIHYHLGQQWIELDTDVILDGSRGYIFRDIRNSGEKEMPRPVTNYIAPAVEIELSALGKRQLTPKVIPRNQDPSIEAAARIANEVLNYRLERLTWPELRDRVIFLTTVTGTGILRSSWEENYNDLTTVGSSDAVSCPQCGETFASSRLPMEQAGEVANHQESLQTVEDDMEDGEEVSEPSVQMSLCPHCPEPVPLEPYEVGPDDLGKTDSFNRPMAEEVPRGNTAIEVVSPFDFFPENSGVGVTPEDSKVWGQVTVRSMDWIEAHYPELADNVNPEDPIEMMRWHPILGDWTILGRFDHSLDAGIYDNHARVYELFIDKTPKNPMGRWITMIGEKIADIELYRNVKKDGAEEEISVPLVKFGAARFKERHGEFWGHSLVDDLISPQNRVNGIDAQVIEARDRMGSPNLLIPNGAELSGPEWDEEYGLGKFMYYEPDPTQPSTKPEVIGSVLMPMGVFEERQACIEDMKTIAGPQDIEQGEAPRNITTTSGLQLLGERADQRRSTRERNLINMFQVTWEHQLELINALRVETDSYSVETEGTWEQKEFDRTVIKDQTKVKIEKQAYVDKSIFQREAAREAQTDGLVQIDSWTVVKRLLELRGLPTDINENLNHQIDRGKQQWLSFIKDGIVPYIDETLDDASIRYDTLGTFLLSSKGREMEEAANWPNIARALAGWKLVLEKLELQDATARQFYGGVIPEEQREQVYNEAMGQYEQQAAEFESQQTELRTKAEKPENPEGGESLSQELAVQDMQMSMPPQPPPPPIFLPNATEQKVMVAWQQASQENGQPLEMFIQQVPDPQILQIFLQFRAVVEAYKLLTERKMMKEQLGIPEGGAPGDGQQVGPGQAGAPNQPTRPPTPPQPPIPQ